MAKPTVFISYSHDDEYWKNLLVDQLGVLQQAGLLDVWADDRIKGGDEWRLEIEEAIDRSAVAIMIVTAKFLTSEFINGDEVPKLLKLRKEKGLRIFPIIAEPSPWHKVEWLQALEVRPRSDPAARRKKADPLSGGSEHQQKMHLAEIAAEICDIIEGAPLADAGTHVGHYRCPELLPFLCNRKEQIFQIESAIQGYGHDASTFACFVHGGDFASHDRFVEVLREVELPRILAMGDKTYIREIFVEWPRKYRDRQDLAARLFSTLSRHAPPDAAGDRERIAAGITSHPGPVIVHTYVDTDAVLRDTASLLNDYAHFWETWPVKPKASLFAFLCVQYLPDRGRRWFGLRGGKRDGVNRLMRRSLSDETLFPRFENLTSIVLEELGEVPRGEAEDWALSKPVQEFRPGLDVRTRVRQIFRDCNVSAMAMEPLADKLKATLEAP